LNYVKIKQKKTDCWWNFGEHGIVTNGIIAFRVSLPIRFSNKEFDFLVKRGISCILEQGYIREELAENPCRAIIKQMVLPANAQRAKVTNQGVLLRTPNDDFPEWFRVINVGGKQTTYFNHTYLTYLLNATADHTIDLLYEEKLKENEEQFSTGRLFFVNQDVVEAIIGGVEAPKEKE